jgi:hypothetical protein
LYQANPKEIPMPILSLNSKISVTAIAVAVALSTAGARAATGASGFDPCRLLAATEAQAFVGVLSNPPYRADEGGAGNVRGDRCVYRGSGGRQLEVTWVAEGATTSSHILEDVPNAMPGELSAPAHRVMAKAPDGPWDKANWIPGGTLFVTKGDQGVNIDMSGASGAEADAIAIARQIVPRFNHPLAYDGAAATAALPKPKQHPASACAVVPAAAAAAAIGTLDGAPQAEPDGSTCVYKVATAHGLRTYKVEFVWQGGLKNYNMLKNGMSTLGSAMGGSIPTAGLDSMPMDAKTSALMGGLMQMVGNGGGGAAPGAATQVGFKTDSTLQGPWDNATLLHGTQLLAVKADVMVGMDLQSADYEKAKALMSAICARL